MTWLLRKLNLQIALVAVRRARLVLVAEHLVGLLVCVKVGLKVCEDRVEPLAPLKQTASNLSAAVVVDEISLFVRPNVGSGVHRPRTARRPASRPAAREGLAR